MSGMNRYTGKPEHSSGRKADFVEKASQDHQCHGKAAIQTAGNDLPVFLETGLRINNHLHDIARRDDGRYTHDNLPEKRKAQSSIHVGKR